MNKVTLLGRMVADVECRKNESTGNSYARFTLAVDRFSKEENGGDNADFIRCVAFGKTAELTAQYFKKGDPYLITDGSIRTGSYDGKNGEKVYTTDIVVNHMEFLPKRRDNAETASNGNDVDSGDFMEVEDGKLPFDF